MKARLLKKIRSDKRLIIEKRYNTTGYTNSGWWYLTDLKIKKSVRHKRLRNILNEYVKLNQVQFIIHCFIYVFISLLIMCCFFALTSCQKTTIKPSGGVVPIINWYNYRAFGLDSLDKAVLLVNGDSIKPRINRSQEINEGDTVTMYYASKNPKIDFAIWNAGNFEIASTIKYFYPVKEGDLYIINVSYIQKNP